ncbi:MAG TPA: helix-turn-helix domain-containing protein [Solirubrobacteraceae bacterium]|nr:helix-turn-helix domain-containing protein [Solirubrobacteraceae bacterium]
MRAAVAADLLARLDALVEEYLARLWDDPELEPFARGELRGRAREVAAGDIGRELAALREGQVPVSCPGEVASSVAMAAEVGFPLSGVLHCYRTGHAVQWDAYAEAVASSALDDDTRAAVLHEGSEFFFEYGNRCARWAERAYEEALEGEGARRLHDVRRVLASEDARLAGYDLTGVHVAVVAEGAVAAEGALVVRAAERTWLWAGAETELDLAGAAGIGGPASGIEGFRRAHREALAAFRVAQRRGEPVRFADAAVESLALADTETARAFVAAELGPIAGAGARETTLRETLAAWFEAEQNVTAAAARLGVHERTVRNRLHAIERELGARPATRRAELETALRLLPLL